MNDLEEMFVSHVIRGGHVQKRSQQLVFKPMLWSATFIANWNDFRYSRITVYVNSIRFTNDLRLLEILMSRSHYICG